MHSVPEGEDCMIRGAIEVVDPDRIAGWIVANGLVLRGAPALAFAGNRCVGSGPIGVFRADLQGAGLGDGFAGFDFSITLRPGEDLASVVIKLPMSDFALLQRGSQVVDATRRFALAAE